MRLLREIFKVKCVALDLNVCAILFFYSICINSIHSQIFFSLGHYDYSFNGDLVYGVSEVDYEMRYIVNSDSIYVFSRRRNLLFFDSNEVEESLLDTVYIIGSNADSVAIKFRSDGDERLLYDFNLEVGSTYKIYPDRLTTPGSDFIDITILGYGDTLISDKIIPYQIVQYTFDESPFLIIDKLYKGIGSLRFYIDIFDIFSNQLGGGLGGPLVCYDNQDFHFVNENLQSEYLNDISNQCLNTTNTIDVSREKRVNIYPNPVNDYLCIRFDDELIDENIFVFSSFGIRYYAFPQESSYNEYCLDVRHLPSGVFYVVFERESYRFLKL